MDLFNNKNHPDYSTESNFVRKSRNKDVYNLFDRSFGIHHAGMLRADRNLTQKLFSLGLIKVGEKLLNYIKVEQQYLYSSLFLIYYTIVRTGKGILSFSIALVKLM